MEFDVTRNNIDIELLAFCNFIVLPEYAFNTTLAKPLLLIAISVTEPIVESLNLTLVDPGSDIVVKGVYCQILGAPMNEANNGEEPSEPCAPSNPVAPCAPMSP
jgi:hypothetical protein